MTLSARAIALQGLGTAAALLIALQGLAPTDGTAPPSVATPVSAAAPGSPGSQIGQREWLRRFGPLPAALPVAAVATQAPPIVAERIAQATDVAGEDKRRARRRREEEFLLLISETDT